MTKILLISGILFILSLIITYLVRVFALRHKILDIPNERSSHSVPTPRGGGVAIVLSWYIGITIFFIWNLIDKSLYFALLSGSILAIISLLDDLISIRPVIRLLIQAITAVIAFVFLGGINNVNFGGIGLNSTFVLYPLTIIGMVWFINLYNFLDGIDGYASVEAIIIAAFLLFFTGNPISFLLIASVSGFLFWNWPKAKIFMGDIGSTQLGFILVVLGIYFHNTSDFSIINWIILSSLFWFDATFTLYRRWRNGEKLSVAHRKHVYQRAVQSGFSHLKVLLYAIGINLVLGLIVWFIIEYDILIIPLFVLTILFLFGVAKTVDKKMPFSDSNYKN